MGLKIWWSWGSDSFFFSKIKADRTVFIFHAKLQDFPWFLIFLSKRTTFFWDFLENIGKRKFWLKVPSLARSVPKPLKVPSLARSVPKPLKVPSLARSVPKPLKVLSLARSVSKPLKVPCLARSVINPLKVGQAQACERRRALSKQASCIKRQMQKPRTLKPWLASAVWGKPVAQASFNLRIRAREGRQVLP